MDLAPLVKPSGLCYARYMPASPWDSEQVEASWNLPERGFQGRVSVGLICAGCKRVYPNDSTLRWPRVCMCFGEPFQCTAATEACLYPSERVPSLSSADYKSPRILFKLIWDVLADVGLFGFVLHTVVRVL